MKTTSKLTFISLFVITFFFTSCGISTDELSDEVVKSMKATEQFQSNSINIKSLILTKKSGNEYTGILETSEPNGTFTYSVEVIYDGNNMTWKIIN